MTARKTATRKTTRTGDPRRNEGARNERRDITAAVRRLSNTDTFRDVYAAQAAFDEVLTYLRTRRARYDKKPGGIGR